MAPREQAYEKEMALVQKVMISRITNEERGCLTKKINVNPPLHILDDSFPSLVAEVWKQP
jgi:hypothetical protein